MYRKKYRNSRISNKNFEIQKKNSKFFKPYYEISRNIDNFFFEIPKYKMYFLSFHKFYVNFILFHCSVPVL